MTTCSHTHPHLRSDHLLTHTTLTSEVTTCSHWSAMVTLSPAEPHCCSTTGGPPLSTECRNDLISDHSSVPGMTQVSFLLMAPFPAEIWWRVEGAFDPDFCFLLALERLAFSSSSTFFAYSPSENIVFSAMSTTHTHTHIDTHTHTHTHTHKSTNGHS